jgi:glucose/arabinose dehydrogenase
MRALAVLAAATILALAVPATAADTPLGLTVPPGFTIEKIATVPNARELAVTPNGDLLVGTGNDTVALVPDAQGTPGAPHVFAHLDDKPVAGVWLDGETLYLGAQFGVYRLPYHPGDREASETPKKIASVRTSGESRDHITTTVAVANGMLYASVGSSCNNCVPDLDATRATIQMMHLDGSDMTPKVVRVRNAIALAVNPATKTLWAGVAGQDELPHGHPYENFDAITVRPGVVDYHWPFCYEDRKPVKPGNDCHDAAIARVVLPAYETPIGATFYPLDTHGRYAFPAEYRGGAFVALHGSWHTPLVPPRVVFVPMNGDEPRTPVDWNDPAKQWREFVGGFQKADSTRVARATGVAVGPDGSLFVSDDQAGDIFRIRPVKG